MPVADFARQVGGERVEVTGLLDTGAEPHDYEPAPSDAEAVAEADLVVSNGAGLDGWLTDLLEQAGADAPRVEAADGVTLLPIQQKGLARDPHVWHDPAAAARMVDNVAAGLVRADSPGAGAYRRRGRLQATARGRPRVRPAGRVPGVAASVTSHDPLYSRGLTPLTSWARPCPHGPEAEPSAQRCVARRAMRAERARTIFTRRARVQVGAAVAGSRAVVSASRYSVRSARRSGRGPHEAELANARRCAGVASR